MDGNVVWLMFWSFIAGLLIGIPSVKDDYDNE